MRIGLISDTHGLLRPEAVAALQGCDHIVHAGDIGSSEILPALTALAPVTAIRGNIDTGAWAATLPEACTVVLGGCRLHIVHDLKSLETLPDGVDVVVAGHSHRPLVERRGDVLVVNPGSAGRRRFSLPITLALLTVETRRVDARIVQLLD